MNIFIILFICNYNCYIGKDNIKEYILNMENYRFYMYGKCCFIKKTGSQDTGAEKIEKYFSDGIGLFH